MATFNPSNGCILASSQGTVCPPDPNYPDVMTEAQQSGNVKTVGRILISGILRSPATAVSSNVPAIQFWSFPYMNTSATVYTDTSGNSSFSYKNDPQGIIKLIPGGSQAIPTEQASVDTMNQTSSTQESSGGILGMICWCLSCMSSIGFISLIGFLVYMALKKP
jgi:hypothetical protein